MSGLYGRSALIALIALRLVIGAIAIQVLTEEPVRDGDVLRFHEVGNSPGIPYVDHEVEYAPLELLAIHLIAGETPATTGTRLVLAALAADLAAAAGIAWGWGRRAATAFLLLGAPLLVFLYLRFDPLTVALAVWAAALCRRRREVAGGMAFGASVLAKLWPAAILPALLMEGRRRAAVAGVVTAIVGATLWLGLTTPSAPLQVLTFRGATGWGVESPIGTAVWLATGGPTRLERGAPRIGAVPQWTTPVLGLALASTAAGIWLTARRREVDAFGTPALGALGALLTFSPLFSLQYASWLVPWAVIAHADGDRRALPLTATVTAATGLLFALYDAGLLTTARFVLVLRAVAVAGLVVSAFFPGSSRRGGDGVTAR